MRLLRFLGVQNKSLFARAGFLHFGLFKSIWKMLKADLEKKSYISI